MRLFRKLTNKEWKEIGEKYKDGGVYMYRGKKTLFWNGRKELVDPNNGDDLIYDEKERQSWEVIIILPGVEVIPLATFRWCTKVKMVIMNDSVKRIEQNAFHSCEILSYVRLSSKLKFIGRCAFAMCESLTSIFIPPSCEEIDDDAFQNCKKLIILHVPQEIQLGERVIARTALFHNSPFEADAWGGYYNHDEVNKWIKTRHNDLLLHRLCCSEDPTFDQTTIIPTKEECCRQDDLGWAPLIYLINNNTAEYDTIGQLVKIGGKDLLLIENKEGANALHWACAVGDEAVIKLLVRIGGRKLVDTLDSEELDENEREFFREFKTSSNIESALLQHDYINAINTSKKDANIDEMLNKILGHEPSYKEVTEIMSIQGIPNEHLQKLQEEYNTAIVAPEDCKVMISFNNASAGEDAVELCNFLNRKGKQVFCTGVFCPKNKGDWREYTEVGANTCEIFIALMTNGWQPSGKCQIETKIIKNRLGLSDENITVIPVYYDSFDKKYDKSNRHYYRTNWASYQGIPSKESSDDWMDTILEYLED